MYILLFILENAFLFLHVFFLGMLLLSILFRSCKTLTFRGQIAEVFLSLVWQLGCFVTLYLKEKKKTNLTCCDAFACENKNTRVTVSPF